MGQVRRQVINVADISRFVLVDIVVDKFVIASVLRGEVIVSHI